MEIRDTSPMIQSGPPKSSGSSGKDEKVMQNTADSFQKSQAPGKQVDISKAAGLLLRNIARASVEVKWTKELSVSGSPLVGQDGTVFVSDSYPDHALHAYDPKTGAELWQRKFDGKSGPHAPVLAPDGTLVVGGDDGRLHVVDPQTGNDKWSLPSDGFSSGITVHDDGRASYRSGNIFICVDLKNQKVISRTPLTGNFESAPVMGRDGTIYGGGHDGNVYAFESGTGNEKWKYKTDAMIRNSPTVGPDGTVYVASIDKTLHAIDPATGAGKWKFPTDQFFAESPSIGPDGTVYAGNSDYYVHSIDPGTGKMKWRFYCGGEIRVTPTPAADGILYVVTDRNVMIGLDQTTGAKVWQYNADSYVHCPPACDGRGSFYFGCNNNKLYAVNVTEVTRRVAMKEAANAPDSDLRPEKAGTIEKEESLIIVDGMKLKVNKEKSG